MESCDILIDKADLAKVRRTSGSAERALAEGEARVAIERFGLTANNVSYAAMGDALGYWAYFPAEDEGWGRLPVWGFGRVAESRSDHVQEGERIFGYLPLSSHLIVTPDAPSALCFSDATAHRTGLHPWYNRYYRCDADPVFSAATADLQPILWALFMTGWMLARELTDTVDEVIVSSASSKTALSLAWALAQAGGARPVGMTSAANRAFVEARGVYDRVLTYDDVTSDEAAARVAYVDIAGNAAATSAAHVALGEQLVDSVLVGATHRAPATSPLPMPGPAPRFFFIPNVAEEHAAADGLAAYHQRFADAWKGFAGWAGDWLDLERGQGADAIEATYGRIVAGDAAPDRGALLDW